VVLRAGWLNRQFDQVSKNVNEWPEWMKRAAGIGEQVAAPAQPKSEVSNPHHAKPVMSQQKLEL
jgi:hypothetical protein